jgi:GDP/UDP-N,N'-diacetylbacillosamine 2-epimerase (hydrolysing)|tara:strand:- start:88 stop:1254 length:1167 start_codon:yes stop_codon:yes gene_type:complete
MKKKKICIVTSTRAEFYLLKNLIVSIKNNSNFKSNLIVTGSHISKKFGNTIFEIKRNNLNINSVIKFNLNKDDRLSLTQAMGDTLKLCSKVLSKNRPDIIILTGDRYEMLVFAIASLMLSIPIAHIHGGEVTSGAIDDSIRHAITKMAHLHFVCNNTYKKRVRQLGEHPSKIYNVGSLGIDNLSRIGIESRKNLQKFLKFKLQKKNLLVTFHPETNQPGKNKKYIKILIDALSKFKEANILFTMPNADPEYNIILSEIIKFCKKNSNVNLIKNLGDKYFKTCVHFFDCLIGNSSSGIIEVPYLKKSTINIGDRQSGRLMSKSIVNTKINMKDILKAIKKINSKSFQSNLKYNKSLYGGPGTVRKIISVLKKTQFEKLIKDKKFYDLNN